MDIAEEELQPLYTWVDDIPLVAGGRSEGKRRKKRRRPAAPPADPPEGERRRRRQTAAVATDPLPVLGDILAPAATAPAAAARAKRPAVLVLGDRPDPAAKARRLSGGPWDLLGRARVPPRAAAPRPRYNHYAMDGGLVAEPGEGDFGGGGGGVQLVEEDHVRVDNGGWEGVGWSCL